MAMVVALIAGSQTPAQAANKPRPDLVIAGKRKVAPQDFFYKRGSPARYNAKTKNKGEARARASETALYWKRRGADSARIDAATLDVPALKPGKGFRTGAGGVVTDQLPPGTYDAVFCADSRKQVRESNERNNCAKSTYILVMATRWVGTISGSAVIQPGVTERWTSDNAVFEFAEAYAGDRVNYRFRGTLGYSISGTGEDGCVYRGSGSAPVQAVNQPGTSDDDFGLTVDYHKGQYWATEQVPAGFEIPYSGVCDAGGIPDIFEGPLNFAGGFFVIDPIDAQPIGDELRLTGSFTEGYPYADGLPTYHWFWDLRAG